MQDAPHQELWVTIDRHREVIRPRAGFCRRFGRHICRRMSFGWLILPIGKRIQPGATPASVVTTRGSRRRDTKTLSATRSLADQTTLMQPNESAFGRPPTVMAGRRICISLPDFKKITLGLKPVDGSAKASLKKSHFGSAILVPSIYQNRRKFLRGVDAAMVF